MAFTVLRKHESRLELELAEAMLLAGHLSSRLASDPVREAIRSVHVVGGHSQAVQEILRQDLEDLGFENEKTRLFAQMPVPALRPDFYRSIGRSGIIAEVERGKTITNDMDLLDLWKCHICPVADFLFLIVPIERRSESGTTIKAFDQASRRLATFFKPQNYVHVEAVFLFGY